MTPNGPDEGELPLSPEDEAGVRAILASLPDPPLPDDVRERISAALAAEAAGTAPGARTVTSLPAHRAPRRSRLPRLLQVAAAVAVLAVGGVAAVAVTGGFGDDGTPTGGPGAVVAGPATPGPVTSSGTDYTDETVPSLVSSLLAGSTPATPTASPTTEVIPPGSGAGGSPEAALSESDAGASDNSAAGSTKKKNKQKKGSSNAGSAGDDLASTGGGSGGAKPEAEQSTGDTASDAAAVQALVNDPTRRDACIAALAGTSGVNALSIDVGTYEGRPAAVVVLPDPQNPARADVWIVGPTCSDADDPFPYSYYSVPLP
jgi:hypothetical protein